MRDADAADARAHAASRPQPRPHRSHRRQREPARFPSRAPPTSGCRWKPSPMTDRKIKRLRELMADIDNVYFTIKSERHSYYQALLSLGDRRVAPAIVAAERNGGNWRAAVAEAGVDADGFIFRDRSQDAHAALGHHRRRHEAGLLPRRVRQVAARGMDAAAQAGARERAPDARCCERAGARAPRIPMWARSRSRRVVADGPTPASWRSRSRRLCGDAQRHAWTASGADASGYVSQADLWRHGSLVVPQPLASDAPWGIANGRSHPSAIDQRSRPAPSFPPIPQGCP